MSIQKAMNRKDCRASKMGVIRCLQKGQLSCLKVCLSPTFDCTCPLGPKDPVCKPKLCFQSAATQALMFSLSLSSRGELQQKPNMQSYRLNDRHPTPLAPTHLREGEACVPTHFPGDTKKQTLRTDLRVVFVSWQVFFPFPGWGLNLLLLCVLSSGVTAAVRQGFISM